MSDVTIKDYGQVSTKAEDSALIERERAEEQGGGCPGQYEGLSTKNHKWNGRKLTNQLKNSHIILIILD